MADVNQKIVDGLEKLGLPWPGGNSVTLDDIAGMWDTLANELSAEVQVLDSAVGGVSSQEWSGDAHDAFVAQWKTQSAQIGTAVSNFHQVADGMRQYAGQIESINEEIVSIVEQILAATAIGAVLTVLTAGISDAVSAAADAAEVARIVALIARFTAWAERIGQTLKDTLGVTDDVAQVLAKLAETVGKLSKTFVTNFAADTGSSMLSQALSGQTVTAGADVKNGALDAAGSTLTDGLLSHVPGIKTVLSGDAAPVLNGTLANMGGSMFEDGVNDAESPGSVSTTQWIEDLVTSGATGAAGSAIGKGISHIGKGSGATTDAGTGDDASSDASGEGDGDGESSALNFGEEGGIALQNLGDAGGDGSSIASDDSFGEGPSHLPGAEGSDSGSDSGSDGGYDGGSESGESGSDTSGDTASFHTADDGSDASSYHTAPDGGDGTGSYAGSDSGDPGAAGSVDGGSGHEPSGGGSAIDPGELGDGSSADGGAGEGGQDSASTAGSDGSGGGGGASGSDTTAPGDSPGRYGPIASTVMGTTANLGVYTVGAAIEGGVQNITATSHSASQILAALEGNGGPMPTITDSTSE